MAAALRLVRDHAFDMLGAGDPLAAVVGNWGSRRTAAAAGFRFDGTATILLSHRGELLDGWQATMTADDPTGRICLVVTTALPATRVTLRPFTESDLDRVVEACCRPGDRVLAGLAAAARTGSSTPARTWRASGRGGPADRVDLVRRPSRRTDASARSA